MKMVSTAWRGWLPAWAMAVTLLLVPLAASADGTGGRTSVAGNTIEAGHNIVSVVFDTDCAPPASSHSLHCHLVSVPSMAVGPNQSLDDDEPVAVAPAAQLLAALNFATHAASAWHIPIAAPPRFILFGNFRS